MEIAVHVGVWKRCKVLACILLLKRLRFVALLMLSLVELLFLELSQHFLLNLSEAT